MHKYGYLNYKYLSGKEKPSGLDVITGKKSPHI